MPRARSAWRREPQGWRRRLPQPRRKGAAADTEFGATSSGFSCRWMYRLRSQGYRIRRSLINWLPRACPSAKAVVEVTRSARVLGRASVTGIGTTENRRDAGYPAGIRRTAFCRLDPRARSSWPHMRGFATHDRCG
jgi:hypothetical protein